LRAPRRRTYCTSSSQSSCFPYSQHAVRAFQPFFSFYCRIRPLQYIMRYSRAFILHTDVRSIPVQQLPSCLCKFSPTTNPSILFSYTVLRTLLLLNLIFIFSFIFFLRYFFMNTKLFDDMRKQFQHNLFAVRTTAS
jgi:hypothetical protein